MNNRKLAVICNILAAICFGIVSYRSFVRCDRYLGIVFVVFTLFSIFTGVLNTALYLEEKKDANEGVQLEMKFTKGKEEK